MPRRGRRAPGAGRPVVGRMVLVDRRVGQQQW